MSARNPLFVLLVAFGAAVLMSGCKKKSVAVTAPPPPVPEVREPAIPAPTVTLSVTPGAIERGQSATLRWSSRNADSALLDQAIGNVPVSGERKVFPAEATTYTIRVQGRGGQATASASITVSLPPPPPKQTATVESLADAIKRLVRDAYFDFDKYTIRTDARDTLSRNAESLKSLIPQFPDFQIVIQGHCDERGSAEYNLALGDMRAAAARDFLVLLGVPENVIRIVSYGKELPQCTDKSEECWQLNRRAHFVAGDVLRPMSD